MSFETRRFFEDGAGATTGGNPIDVAAIMAKSGAKMDASSSATAPEIIIEESKAPGASIPDVKPAENAPGTAAETAAIPEPQAKPDTPPAASAAVADWRAELKRADKAEILKELGYDDKMIGFYNKWSTDGNIAEYLKAVSMDYSKMSPEALMRHQLQEDFPEFTPEEIEEIYAAKVTEAFKLDPEVNTEAEIKRGKLLLTAETKKIREGLIQRQKDYVLTAKPPAPIPDESVAQAAKQEADQKAYMERFNAAITGHEATKSLLANKTLSIGEGDNAFNYGVTDPQQLLAILQSPKEYVKHIFREDDTPIVDKQLLIAAVARDGNAFINEVIKYGRSLGAKSAVEEIENAKKPEGTASKPDVALTPAQALAKGGVLTSND